MSRATESFLRRSGLLVLVAASCCSLASCTALQEGIDPVPGLTRNLAPASIVSPSGPQSRVAGKWWETYGDPALKKDVETALSNSPTLASFAHRLERSESRIKSARAAAWPRLNLGLGYLPGRSRDVDFGPYDMAPWQSNSQFQWELDLWGKFRRGVQSARANHKAAFYDYEAAKLLLISRLAEARFRLYRLREEKRILGESLRANEGILQVLREQESAGIVSNTDLLRADGEHGKLERGLLELERLEQLAYAEIHTLRGRAGTPDRSGSSVANSPPPPGKSFSFLLQSHPTLLAAEERVRSSFHLEESTRLNLLPSIQLKGGAAGRSTGFLLSDFQQWQTTFGPTLDLPVFDPARLAALEGKKASTREVCAQYRETLLQVLEEVETSYLNWSNRQQQLATVEREFRSLEEARDNVRATFKAGLVSQIEILEAERSALAASRARAVLRQAILNDHVGLIRALGGGGPVAGE